MRRAVVELAFFCGSLPGCHLAVAFDTRSKAVNFS